MRLIFSRSDGMLSLNDDQGELIRELAAFSIVRNELNGERPDPSRLPDIFYSQNADGSQGKPTMPRPFPIGSWLVPGSARTDEQWLKPVKLITNAHQRLDVWKLKNDGTYDCQSGETIEDYGYRVHFANGSHHTDGCIGLVNLDDMLYLENNLIYPLILEVKA